MNGSEMLREGIVEEAPQEHEAPAAKPAAKEGQPDPQLKALERELASLRSRVNESEQNARFWYEKARTEPAKAQATAETKKVDPAEFVELLASKGPAAVEELIEQKLRSGGFVSKAEVEHTVNTVKAQATAEMQLQRDYPELEDPKSEMFRETAKQYQELIAETPELKGKPSAMRTAAKLAAAALDLDREESPAPKPRRATSQREDVDTEDEEDGSEEREAQRVRRVRSQQSTSRRTQREDSDDDLSPIQKSIVENLRNAGANITEDKLKKRIAAGTSLSGKVGLAVAALSGARKGRR